MNNHSQVSLCVQFDATVACSFSYCYCVILNCAMEIRCFIMKFNLLKYSVNISACFIANVRYQHIVWTAYLTVEVTALPRGTGVIFS